MVAARLKVSHKPSMITPSAQRGVHWFLKGARGIASLPAIILMSAFVGFCGFAVEAGIPLGETVFMTGMIWALPAKVCWSARFWQAFRCRPPSSP
jgi:hypothetical protein